MSKIAKIKDFPDYYISDSGDVYSRNYKRTGKIKKMKSYKQPCGYLLIMLSKNGKTYHKYIHRLIADMFIPNPYNKPQVNHIDGNKTNNALQNLEWVSAKENALHAVHVLKVTKSPCYWKNKEGKNHPRSKTVLQVKNGEVVAEFGSLLEAERKTKINFRNISLVCNGYRKTAGGYEWKYK